jgi:ribosomal protein S27AE
MKFFKKESFISYIFTVTKSRKCPSCGSSDDIIEWDNGYLCRDCGYEW